jgi:hypothetical protein
MTSRKRRRELRQQVERAAAYADQRLREALALGWIDAADLPPDTRQRIQDALQPPLQGHITGDRIEIEAEGRSNTKQ